MIVHSSHADGRHRTAMRVTLNLANFSEVQSLNLFSKFSVTVLIERTADDVKGNNGEPAIVDSGECFFIRTRLFISQLTVL